MAAPSANVPLTPAASAAFTSLVSSAPAPSDWSIDSWRTKPISQQPDYSTPTYKDRASVDSALETLRRLPPLVHHAEVDELRHQLSEVAAGHRFFLQGGDCAERFQDCSQRPIEQKFKILLQMSLILTWGARLPVVRIGRVAGQYGKPRSSPVEKLPSGEVVPSFKGDNINGFEATAESRAHDPQRLVQSHFHSAATLNYIRALIKGGYADLHQSQSWDMSGVVNRDKRTRYQEISKHIVDGLDFMSVKQSIPHPTALLCVSRSRPSTDRTVDCILSATRCCFQGGKRTDSQPALSCCVVSLPVTSLSMSCRLSRLYAQLGWDPLITSVRLCR